MIRYEKPSGKPAYETGPHPKPGQMTPNEKLARARAAAEKPKMETKALVSADEIQPGKKANVSVARKAAKSVKVKAKRSQRNASGKGQDGGPGPRGT